MRIETVVDNPMNALMPRVQTREIARDLGFNLRDQAFISLATWSLVRAIGLGDSVPGNVIIEHLQEQTRDGVQVACNVP